MTLNRPVGIGSGNQTSSRARERVRAVTSNRPILRLGRGPGMWLQMDQFYSWDRARDVTSNRPVLGLGIGPVL